MKGTLLYQCRLCGHEDIPISSYVEMVFCPTSNKNVELTPSTKTYLRQFFSENEVATIGQNAHQTSPVATGSMKTEKK